MMTAHFPGSMHTFLETPYLPRSDSLAFHDWPSTPAITNPPPIAMITSVTAWYIWLDMFL